MPAPELSALVVKGARRAISSSSLLLPLHEIESDMSKAKQLLQELPPFLSTNAQFSHLLLYVRCDQLPFLQLDLPPSVRQVSVRIMSYGILDLAWVIDTLVARHRVETFILEGGYGALLRQPPSSEEPRLCNRRCVLKSLVVRGFHLEDEEAVLEGLLSSYGTVASIDLSSNGITNKGLSLIVSQLWNNVALSSLNIAGNDITDKGITILSQLLIVNHALISLEIGYSAGITHLGLKALLSILQKRGCSLIHLSLQWMGMGHMGDDLANSFTIALARNYSLTSLDISYNDLNAGVWGGMLLAVVNEEHSPLIHITTRQKEIDVDLLEPTLCAKQEDARILRTQHPRTWLPGVVCRWIAWTLPKYRSLLCPLFKELNVEYVITLYSHNTL